MSFESSGSAPHRPLVRAAAVVTAGWLGAALAVWRNGDGWSPALVGALALGSALVAAWGCAIVYQQLTDDRARLQAQLARLKLRVDELNAFGASVAHDLRAPLAPIRVRSQLIAMSEVGDDIRGHARKIDRAAERLSRLIDVMLALARHETGDGRACTDVATVAHDVVDDFAERLSERGARIDLQICDDTYVACEAEVVASILQNLVDNAIKHGLGAERLSSIELRVSQCGRSARICVEDHGRGVRAEDSGLIFAAGVRSRSSGGAGLGLATVRRLVELRGGSVEVHDGSAGGACFTVELPLASRSAPAAAGRQPPASTPRA